MISAVVAAMVSYISASFDFSPFHVNNWSVFAVEFMFEYVVSKANDRKIFMHKSFEEIVARYW